MSAAGRNITPAQAAEALKCGELVALPTETVYGLGANALDPLAVAKIFAAKERPSFDPLIVHIAEADEWPRVVSQFPTLARRLADRFWPGPLTLVLPKVDAIPDIVTSGLSTVGLRVPDHPLTREVLRLADLPIAAPSANPFGKLSPTTAEHVRRQLGSRVDWILDGGPCRVGVESTILQLDGDEATLLRPGGISLEEIESLIGPVRRRNSTSIDEHQPVAPGMLAGHYSPRTKLVVIEQATFKAPVPRAGLLTMVPPHRPVDSPVAVNQHRAEHSFDWQSVEAVSPTEDLTVAAASFFQALHRLDQSQLDVIFATRFPQQGLGRALNDRLQRAAHR